MSDDQLLTRDSSEGIALGILSRAAQRIASTNTKPSGLAIVALATSALVWGAMAAQLPMIAQAKVPTGLAPVPLVPRRVSRSEWKRWYKAKVGGGLAFRLQKKEMPREENACSAGTPALGLSAWESTFREAALGSRGWISKVWEPMEDWGRELRGRVGAYPRAKRHLVSGASKEISTGAAYMVEGEEEYAEADEGIANVNCNQTGYLTEASDEYSEGFPRLSKGFLELLLAR